jgi:hypothetical protein
MDKRRNLLNEFLTVGSSDDDNESTGSSPSVSGSSPSVSGSSPSVSGSTMMPPSFSGSAMMSPSVSGSFMPSAAAATPSRPAPSPLTGRRPSPSMFNISKNKCKHGKQPAFCLDCFDEFNSGQETPVGFGRICQHRRFMSAACIPCGRERKVKKDAATVASSDVASSAIASSAVASSDRRRYYPSLSPSEFSYAGPQSNPFGRSSLARVFDDEDDESLLPARLDDYSDNEYHENDENEMDQGGGSKSYKKSARKLIKKAKRSSRKAKRSSKKAKRSSKKPKGRPKKLKSRKKI